MGGQPRSADVTYRAVTNISADALLGLSQHFRGLPSETVFLRP